MLTRSRQTTPDAASPPPDPPTRARRLHPNQPWVPIAGACVVAALVLGVPALVSSVGQTNAASKADLAQNGPTVLVEPSGFSPPGIAIRAGQTVTFAVAPGDQQSSNIPHEIVSSSFTCPVTVSASCSHQFTASGTYHFVDAPSHSATVGLIVVRS